MLRVRTRSEGFSVLESAIVLVVVAFVVTLGVRLQQSSQQARVTTIERARLTQAHQVVVRFALTQHRLPCPDTTANGVGVEAQSGGICASSTGWLPYVTLGMPIPTGKGTDARMRYGVYRGATSLATVTATELESALASALPQPPDTVFPYVPTRAGCAVAQLNPAFALAISDGPQEAMNRCFEDSVGLSATLTDVEGLADLLAQVHAGT